MNRVRLCGWWSSRSSWAPVRARVAGRDARRQADAPAKPAATRDRAGGVCVSDTAKNALVGVPGRPAAQAGAGQAAADVLPLEGGGAQEGRQDHRHRHRRRRDARRHPRPAADGAEAARSGPPHHGDPAARVAPQVDRRRGRRTGRCSSAAWRRTTSSSRTRRSARRPRPRSSATTSRRATRARPASSRASRTRARRRWTASRKAAITYYTMLVDDYSGQPSTTFPTNPPPAYPQLDEVYYYLAYEYEQASDTANARRVYLDLITKTPNSKYIPNAYLAFGELFFNEAHGRSRRSGTRRKQAYIKVIAKPPPENKVYGYAWYKLAYVFWNQGDLPHALDAFKKTIDFGTQFSQLPNARSSPRARARTSSRCTRSRAARPTPTTSSRT